MAVLAAELGQLRTAVRLLGVAYALAETLGVTSLAPVSRKCEDLVSEAISGRLTPAHVAAARVEGRALPLDAAIREAEEALDLLAQAVSFNDILTPAAQLQRGRWAAHADRLDGQRRR